MHHSNTQHGCVPCERAPRLLLVLLSRFTVSINQAQASVTFREVGGLGRKQLRDPNTHHHPRLRHCHLEIYLCSCARGVLLVTNIVDLIYLTEDRGTDVARERHRSQKAGTTSKWSRLIDTVLVQASPLIRALRAAKLHA